MMLEKISNASNIFNIKDLNLTDYRDAYLLILGGVLLVIAGLILAFLFYRKERKSKVNAKMTRVSQEIKEITKKAGGSKAIHSIPISEENRSVSPGGGKKNQDLSKKEKSGTDSTELLVRQSDETATM